MFFEKVMNFFQRLDILIVLLSAHGIISKYQNLWGSLAQQFKKDMIHNQSIFNYYEKIYLAMKNVIPIFSSYLYKKSIMI